MIAPKSIIIDCMIVLDDFLKAHPKTAARVTALTDFIRKKTPLSFSTFMGDALYHPQLGYYQAETFTIGKAGDFTTAPELSKLFAHSLANQCQQILKQLSQPNVLELGAGTGQLAVDLLLALEQRDGLPQHYFIYEISTSLKQKQHTLLKERCPTLLSRVVWLDELPANFSGLVIANEVLDALPTTCFAVTEQGIFERIINWKDERFIWELAPANIELNTEIQTLSLTHPYASEINLSLKNFITQLSLSLNEGVILFIDYGYGEREYYHPQRQQGTLTSFHQHLQIDDPLLYPGLQDITAHVDFTRLAIAAQDAGLDVLGYTTQAAFLLATGLIDEATKLEKTLNAKEIFQLHQSIKYLTLPTEMGERIKVMALAKNANITLPLLGFTLQDRRRDL